MYAFGNKRIRVIRNSQGVMVVYARYMFPIREVEDGLRTKWKAMHGVVYSPKDFVAYMFAAIENYINAMITEIQKQTRLKSIHTPEVTVTCMDCGESYNEGELVIRDYVVGTDYKEVCPYCGGTHIADAG